MLTKIKGTDMMMFKKFYSSVATLAFAGMLMSGGCDNDNSTGALGVQDIDKVVISPDSTSLEVGEVFDFSAVALTAGGDTVRDVNFVWKSSDPDLFTVEDDGTATALASGEAYCGVGISDETAKAKGKKKSGIVPIGLDSAVVHIF